MISAIYIITTIIFGGFVVRKIKSNNINAITIFTFMIMFAYLIVPIMVFFLGDAYQDKYPITWNIYNSNDLERVKALIYTFLLIISSTLVYYCIPIKKVNTNIINTKYNEKMIYTIVKKYWFVLFGIGMFGFILVIFKFGGISNYLNSSGGSRGIYSDIGDNNSIAPGSIFAYANILSRALLGCIYPLILMYEMKPQISRLIGIIFIICLDTMVLVYNAGKLQAIIFYVPILIYFMNKYVRKKNKMLIYLFISIITFLSMSKMDDLFFYLNHGVTLSSYKDSWSFIDNLMALVNQFTYPYSNLLLSDKMNNVYGFRFGIDYIAPIFNLIPARFLNIIGLSKIDALYHITSDYYHIKVLGFSLIAGVPNDLLTVAIRQLSFPGVILCGSFMGMLLAYVDIGVKKLNEMGNKYSQLALTNCVVVIVILFLEPNSVTMAYYHILFSLFLTRSILKQREKSPVVLENENTDRNHTNRASPLFQDSCHIPPKEISEITGLGGGQQWHCCGYRMKRV